MKLRGIISYRKGTEVTELGKVYLFGKAMGDFPGQSSVLSSVLGWDVGLYLPCWPLSAQGMPPRLHPLVGVTEELVPPRSAWGLVNFPVLALGGELPAVQRNCQGFC